MKLMHPIDALNNKAYIEVMNVCYPSTTKNVTGTSCYIDLSMQFNGFLKVIGKDGTPFDDATIKGYNDAGVPLTYTKQNSNVKVHTKRVDIPEGIYSLKRLTQYINTAYNEYDVFFSQEKNGKIKINVNLNVEYWLQQKTASYTLAGVETAHDGGTCHEFRKTTAQLTHVAFYDVTITMSEKLAFMLGFSDTHHTFTDVNTSETSKFAEFLPDVSDGLNKIFIYCPELERVLVGDTSSELLCTIPIQWSGQGDDDGELICFNPPKIKKAFKKANIDILHISLRDSIGELVPFDSGTVTIECLIHYA